MKKRLLSTLLVAIMLLSICCIPGYAEESEWETITLGIYEQSGLLSDGPEELEWFVLDEKDGKLLLLSRYALESLPFNESGESCTWETSSIRQWLNGEFLETAFSAELADTICTTKHENDRYSKGADCGNDTEDKVFLLSEYEADHYFDRDSQRRAEPSSMCEADINENGNCWWMLRTMGNSSKNVMGVHEKGGLNYNGRSIDEPRAIRPAMWVDMELIGDMYYWKAHEHEILFIKALDWYMRAAEHGRLGAMREIGYIYSEVEGFVDYEKAIFWYEKAAELGYATAMYDLGCIYHAGKGVPIDVEKAASWYEKGAEAGHAGAMVELADMYAEGDGVIVDYEKAERWYKEAKKIIAEHDNPYYDTLAVQIFLGLSKIGVYY